MFNKVLEFERIIADFFGAPYAVSTDCCTHAIELCLRLTKPKQVTCPTNTYISIPFTFQKLSLDWKFEYNEWYDYYYIGGTNIIDAAVLWRKNSYISNTFMCVSFQHRKHLSLGRGGIILLDNTDAYMQLTKMRYDGRDILTPWRDQNIDTIGYHYYMTPEIAISGIEKFKTCQSKSPRLWSFLDYPYLSNMKVFSNGSI